MPMTSGAALLEEVRAELAAVADPAHAPAMQAYMKSAMPFHGVRAPVLRALSKARFKSLRFSDFDELARAVRAMWHGAKYREERYAALRLLDGRAHHPAAEALVLFEELIHTGAWWDVVDDVANHWLHPLLASDPVLTGRTLRRWIRSDDLWLRRAAIIAQVHAGPATDVALLFEVIEPWALRAVARHHPNDTRRWLAAHGERASGVTRREALRAWPVRPVPGGSRSEPIRGLWVS